MQNLAFEAAASPHPFIPDLDFSKEPFVAGDEQELFSTLFPWLSELPSAELPTAAATGAHALITQADSESPFASSSTIPAEETSNSSNSEPVVALTVNSTSTASSVITWGPPPGATDAPLGHRESQGSGAPITLDLGLFPPVVDRTGSASGSGHGSALPSPTVVISGMQPTAPAPAMPAMPAILGFDAYPTVGQGNGLRQRRKSTTSISRKKTTSWNGRSSNWDTTRRKHEEIARLEEELKEKLVVAEKLQHEQHELQRKERLLRLQVAAGERNLLCHGSEGITPHMMDLLQTFRSQVSQMYAKRLVSKLPRDAKSLTLEDFTTTWSGFAMEVSDLFMEEAQLAAGEQGAMERFQKRMSELTERMNIWCMSICVYDVTVILRAESVNMQTGENSPPPAGFWRNVVGQLNLSEEQVRDMHEAFSLYQRLISQLRQQEIQTSRRLGELIEAQASSAGKQHNFCDATLTSELDDLVLKLQVFHARCNMLHTMQAFLVLGILTQRQQMQLAFYSFPYFPCIKNVLLAVLGVDTA